MAQSTNVRAAVVSTRPSTQTDAGRSPHRWILMPSIVSPPLWQGSQTWTSGLSGTGSPNRAAAVVWLATTDGGRISRAAS